MTENKREPMRCFEGTAKPYEAFWTWRNEALTPSSSPEGGGEEKAEPEVELYGYISEYSWWEDDITPKMFKDDLYRYGKGGPITIRINSYGGDVIAASMMNTILRDYPGRKTVQIDAIAASAATVVAVAGDRVRIQDTAYFMIHDPLVLFFFAALNIEELNRLSSSLQAVKEGIINAYEGKTGLGRTRLSRLMTDETWMDAQKAKDFGFVDEIVKQGDKEKGIGEQKSAPVPNAAVVNCLRNYLHVPEEIQKAVLRRDIPATAAASELRLTDNQKREAQFLRERIKPILKKEETP
jgi:ATP-dependent Clp protease, protease subunit